jgi:hypothetical protein
VERKGLPLLTERSMGDEVAQLPSDIYELVIKARTRSGAVMQQRSIPHLISDHQATTDTTIVDN